MALSGEAAAREVLECARYGEIDELQALVESGADVNFRDGGGNTALHMACANGFVECVAALLDANATYSTNNNGNSPLHWGVLNQHKEIVKLILERCEGVDVLAQNSFGKGALSDAFGAGETMTEITKLLLEHKSADKLEKEGNTPTSKVTVENDEDAEGGKKDDIDPTDIDSKSADDEPSKDASDSKVVQTYTYDFDFSPNLIESSAENSSIDGSDTVVPGRTTISVREVATDWTGQVFDDEKARAQADTTGMQVWATSLVFSRWVVKLQEQESSSFENKNIIEIGAGAGVPGLVSLFYTKASTVTLTDVFSHTLNNLRFNVAANLKKNPSRSYSNVAVKELDWKNTETFPQGSFDIVIGSDLVYDDELVDCLVTQVDHLLSASGVFYMVAGSGRQGVQTLIARLESSRYVVLAFLVLSAG